MRKTTKQIRIDRKTKSGFSVSLISTCRGYMKQHARWNVEVFTMFDRVCRQNIDRARVREMVREFREQFN